MNKLTVTVGGSILVAIGMAIGAGPAVAQAIKAALVKNVDERGRSPFTLTFSCEASLVCVGSTGLVPAGKRLVIEHANGTAPANTLISISGNDSTTGQPVGPTFFLPSTNQNGATFIVNADLVMYLEAARGVRFSVSGGNIAVATTITLTGYLVDLTI